MHGVVTFAKACALGVIMSSTVLAQLEEVDDPAFGEGALTRDVAQDLLFLDPIHTIGLSYIDMLTELEPGGDFAGYRHATVEEVARLLNNAGFTPALFPPYDDQFGFVIFPSGQAQGALAGVQDTLSVTLTEAGGLTATLGYTSTASTFFPGSRLVATLAVQRTGFGIDFASVTPLEEDGGGNEAEAAHWLIRESEPTPSCRADFDENGVVDLTDFGTFGAAFGSVEGDANYDPAPDFDGDGDVDLTDFGVFGTQFGDTSEICNS